MVLIMSLRESYFGNNSGISIPLLTLHVFMVLLGDFNAIRNPSEKFDGQNFDFSATGDFNSCINVTEALELAIKGPWFTWTSRQEGLGDKKSRINRAVSVFNLLYSSTIMYFISLVYFERCCEFGDFILW